MFCADSEVVAVCGNAGEPSDDCTGINAEGPTGLCRLIESHFGFPLGLSQWDQQLSNYHDVYQAQPCLPSPSVPAHAGTDGDCREE